MTDQREFPFFVNGQFWRFNTVTESDIRRGFIYQCVITKPKCIVITNDNMPDLMSTMKKVSFQLVECGEQQYRMVAHWVQGFWVIDSELVLDDRGCLYLKEK